MVPEGWKVLSLGEICSGKLQTGPFGSQLHANEYTETGIPVLMPKDLINGRANTISAAKISPKRAKSLEKHRLKEGDLIFSRRGDVSRFALIDYKSKDSICGTGCLKATPNKQHSSIFLSYFLQKNAVKKWLEQNAVGQTMPNMNTAILFELPLLSASSRDEEDKIAKILQTWDRAIATTEKLINASKQQKKALMQQLLTGKKRFAGFEGEWDRKPVSEFGRVVTGSTPPKSIDSHYGGNTSWATAEDFKKKYVANTKTKLTPSGVKTARIVPKGSVLVTCIASIGKNAIAGEELATNQQINSVVINNENCNEFFYYVICFSNSKLLSWAGTTAVPILNKRSFEKISLPAPKKCEQQQIAKVLKSADCELDFLRTKLAHLKQEKKALMQQLLTGKRRVKIDD